MRRVFFRQPGSQHMTRTMVLLQPGEGCAVSFLTFSTDGSCLTMRKLFNALLVKRLPGPHRWRSRPAGLFVHCEHRANIVGCAIRNSICAKNYRMILSFGYYEISGFTRNYNLWMFLSGISSLVRECKRSPKKRRSKSQVGRKSGPEHGRAHNCSFTP